MNKKKILDSTAIGILFSRSSINEEIEPSAWKSVCTDVLQIAQSANAILGIYAEDGAGRTTFNRQLADTAAESLDVLHISPTAPSLQQGWIALGLSQWLTSDAENPRLFQQKLVALRETDRPILICLDLSELADPEQTAGELGALLNLADASAIKLSVLLSCPSSLWQKLSTCKQILNRILYSKALPAFSEQELAELIGRRLDKHESLRGILEPNQILNLAKNAGGSPLRMIRLVCAQLGIDMPTASTKTPQHEKVAAGKRAKKTQAQETIPFDDLLAPNSK